MSRKKRTDANQQEITKALREEGFSVLLIYMVGDGCPDILVGAFGKNYLFEIKDPDKFPSQRKLTKDEEKFFKNWRGQVHLIETAEQAATIIRKDNE